jgi:hypothetical protein
MLNWAIAGAAASSIAASAVRHFHVYTLLSVWLFMFALAPMRGANPSKTTV